MLVQIKPKLYNYAKRGFLGKTDQLYLCESIGSHHPKAFQKNNICDRSRDIRLNSFGPNWV